MRNVSRWRLRSREVINKVADRNKGQDEATLRKLISEVYPFGMRKMYPYKIWLDEVKNYFASPEVHAADAYYSQDDRQPLPGQKPLF